VLLFDPPGSWKLAPQHRKWLWPCAVVALAAIVWYGVTWALSSEMPGGSSLPGLVAGVLAGLLMLYLFAYALRKVAPFSLWFRARPTAFWLAQHIWLGLLTIPLVLVHGARITQWPPLTTALMTAYAIVIVSGVWGLYLQQRVPTRLLQEVPDETIRSQIPELIAQLQAEADLLILAACGPPPEAAGSHHLPVPLTRHLDVVRAARSGKGTGLLAVLPAEPIPDTEALRRYFTEVVEPYLQQMGRSRSRLQLRARVEKDFRALRDRLPAGAQPIIDALHDLCNRRRQFDEQADLHDRLHLWVGFHLVLSVLLLVLLVAHIITALLYW
jgi:hypothetical protein